MTRIRTLTVVAGAALAITLGLWATQPRAAEADCALCSVGQTSASTAGNIAEVAAKAGKFNTLLAAAKAAGLAETLATGGPFTVFAPTDEAFAKLPAGTVEDLLKPQNKEKLAAIIKYHVVAGEHKAADVVGKTAIPTLQGGELTVKVEKTGGKTAVRIDNATVVATDVAASNGVIHIIDSVVLPK